MPTESTTNENANYKAEMQALKKAQTQKSKEAVDPERGLVLVHTGDGKGKSSSAFGVVARALGWGQSVAVVQFIKGTWKTGEKQFFDKFDDQIDWFTMGEGFTWNTQDKARDIEVAGIALAKAAELLASNKYDLVVLDEINIAMRYDYIDVQDVITALEARGQKTGCILTGRNAKDELIAYADLVTEMREIKHPYHAGIKAQPGIDY